MVLPFGLRTPKKSRPKSKREGQRNSVKEGDMPRQQKDKAFMGCCGRTRHSPTIEVNMQATTISRPLLSPLLRKLINGRTEIKTKDEARGERTSCRPETRDVERAKKEKGKKTPRQARHDRNVNMLFSLWQTGPVERAAQRGFQKVEKQTVDPAAYLRAPPAAPLGSLGRRETLLGACKVAARTSCEMTQVRARLSQGAPVSYSHPSDWASDVSPHAQRGPVEAT